MKSRYQLTLIVLIIFLVFSPAITGELISGDDEELFSRLQTVTQWNIPSFLPHGLTYYRPLTMITYYSDKLIWQLNPIIMHLENILFHSANACLVFFIVREFLPKEDRQRSFLPLAAAFLFSLHPITAESVNWISGRTDLIAGFFILLSALMTLHFYNQRRMLGFCLATLFFAFGILSKEVSVAFLAGFFCLVFFTRDQESIATSAANSFPKELKRNMSLILFGIMGGLFFISILVQIWNSGKGGLTLKVISGDLWYALLVCLRAFAFYIKKIIWPFPLNFAILEVDPLYELLAIPLLLVCLYLLWKRTPVGAMILTGFFLLTPSFFLAFNQIAWTPYAERYLYLPCAFIAPGFLLALSRIFLPLDSGKFSVVIVFIMIGMAGATFTRTITWRSNLSLWSDTVQKSPLSASALNEYGLALYKAGRLLESRDNFEKASKMTSFNYNPTQGINHGLVLLELNDLWGAKGAFETVLKKTRGKSDKAKNGLIEVLEKLVEQTKSNDKKSELQEELMVLKGQYR